MNEARAVNARNFTGHRAYHEACGNFVCGVLINQESWRPPERFITGKVVENMCATKRGTRCHLAPARLDIAGVVEAAAMLQTPH